MDNVNLIKNFCNDLNTSHLDRLEPEHSVLLQRIALHCVQTGKGKQNIAKKVLKYYNLSEDGTRTNLKEVPRKKVEGNVNNMTVALTGARPGDIISGSSKGTKGAVMRIHDVSIPPQRRTLDGVRFYPDLWVKFLLKLSSVPFFSEMTTIEKEIWLDINEADNENSIGQEGSRLELIQPGTSDFATKITEEDLDLLIQGNPHSEDGYWNYEEIQNMIPRKPGSKALRHTLILIRSFWKIAIDYEVTDSFKDLVVNVEKGTLIKDAEATPKQEIFVLGSITKAVKKICDKWVRPTGKTGVQNVGFLVSKRRVNFSEIDRIINEIIPGDIEPVRYAMREFTPASHKSLLQKIIRFSPEKVDIGKGQLVDPRFVLLISMGTLASMPGSFVPDIQRYVSGMESFTKRVAVSILEDSYLPEGYNNQLFSILSGSLLSKRARTWSPSEKLLKIWLRLGILGYEQDMAVVTDYHYESHQEPFVLNYEQEILKNASAVLDELKSFSTDLGLARGLAKEYPNYTVNVLDKRPSIMPIYHCVDHHWAPGVVHYFRPSFVYEVSKDFHTGKPFSKLIKTIWDECSSINPRRDHIDYDEYSNRYAVNEIRSAQRLYLIAKQEKHKTRPIIEIFEMEYMLEDAWIAGLVGAIEVKTRGHPTMLVTLSSDNPIDLIVVKRPSRNMNDEPLSEKAEESAIEIAKHRLRNGIILNKAHSPTPLLQNAKVYLRNKDGYEYYTIIRKGYKQETKWSEIKYLQIALPVHPSYDLWNVEKALTIVGTGIEEDAEEKLQSLVEETSKEVVRRALVYISTFSPLIEINRVSREGSGTYHSVLLEDVPAYQFLLRISTLYPSALSPALYKPSTFTVPNGPVLWTIRKKIAKQLTNSVSEDITSKWKIAESKRNLWLHQIDTISDMIRNNETGSKGNFIWLPVGSGKTTCVLSFLKYLSDKNKLPPYVVYTLPQSAVKSIISEIKRFDIPINLIIPLKNISKKVGKYKLDDISVSQSCDLHPFSINLIEHDHLRICEEVLTRYAPMCMFIVDEVHKALSDTKRTSVALELAHLSKDFIALTGTPVIDSKTYKLIGWLEQIVPYEVNTKNFWVAASSMIARKFKTNIKVDSREIIAPFTKREEEKYRQLVPHALGGTNTNPSFSDWQLATEVSYESATREMVNVTKNILEQERGVMLVAKDAKHQEVLYNALINKNVVVKSDVFLIKGDNSINLTDESVEAGKVHDYKVVIVPIRKAEGYTLTRLSAMVTSVYPSNQATRTQIAGRINRLSQRSKEILYITVHVGVLTAILENHNDAKNLSLALQGLAQDI